MNIVLSITKDHLKSLLEDAELHDCSIEKVLQRRIHIKLPAPELKGHKIEKPAPKPQRELRKSKGDATVKGGNSEAVAAQMSRGLVKPQAYNSKDAFQLIGGTPVAKLQADILERKTVTIDDLLALIVHAPKNRKFTLRQLVESLNADLQHRFTPAVYKSLAQLLYRSAKTNKRLKYDASVSPIQYWIEG